MRFLTEDASNEFTTFDRSNRFFFSSLFLAISSRLVFNKACFLYMSKKFLTFKSVFPRKMIRTEFTTNFEPIFLSLRSYPLDYYLTRHDFSNISNKFLTFEIPYGRCLEQNLLHIRSFKPIFLFLPLFDHIL